MTTRSNTNTTTGSGQIPSTQSSHLSWLQQGLQPRNVDWERYQFGMPRFVTPTFPFSEENPPLTWEQKFRSQQPRPVIENDELCPPPPPPPHPLYAYPQSPVFTSDLNTSRILTEERPRILKTARSKVDSYMEDGVMKIDPIPGMYTWEGCPAQNNEPAVPPVYALPGLKLNNRTDQETRKACTNALLNSEGTVSVDGSYSMALTVEEGNGLECNRGEMIISIGIQGTLHADGKDAHEFWTLFTLLFRLPPGADPDAFLLARPGTYIRNDLHGESAPYAPPEEMRKWEAEILKEIGTRFSVVKRVGYVSYPSTVGVKRTSALSVSPPVGFGNEPISANSEQSSHLNFVESSWELLIRSTIE
ncbi:hypothetical protein BKA93DRAFT_752223 [Sparassis latifolia]